MNMNYKFSFYIELTMLIAHVKDPLSDESLKNIRSM